MKSKLRIGSTARRAIVAAAFLAALGTSGPGLAVDEIEPNSSMASAQRLEIGPDGRVEVTGTIGSATGIVVGDVDFYTFNGRAGDVVTVDVDAGMKRQFSGLRSVDTIVAIFGLGGKLLAENNDAGTLDEGSVHAFDARIDKFPLPASGPYTIGVSSNPRNFQDGGTLMSNTLGLNSNGTYTLVVSGVSPSMLRIEVDIRPGNGSEPAPLNLKSKGNIPVALLSSAEFIPLQVDPQSLRFGAKGTEESLLRCDKYESDLNADGRPDLVCQFDTRATAFEAGSLKGIVTGSLTDGRRFEGSGHIKIVPAKSQD